MVILLSTLLLLVVVEQLGLVLAGVVLVVFYQTIQICPLQLEDRHFQ
jgi:hypothetical protein